MTREHKNQSWIAQEIEIFSNFAWSIPTLVLKVSSFPPHNLLIAMINYLYETFGWKKIALFFRNVVSAPCSETDPNLRCHFWTIVGFRSPNFAQRWTLLYWNRISRHFGFWEKKYLEMEFQPSENDSSPFCRIAWFHIHIMVAFFHLSVWLIDLGTLPRRFCSKHRLDS